MMVAPAIMIFRNVEVIDKATISTNLGVTMRIGAGPETSGGYVVAAQRFHANQKSSLVLELQIMN
jgi:hypothetical protein